MPSIEGASIRSILDSRGNPTIEVEIRSGRALGRAAAPSGASTGTHEPPAWPRGGVDEALRTFRDSVEPRLKARDVADQAGHDSTLHEVDGTANFARIGANVATAASLANAKAAANSTGKPLYRYLGGAPRPTLPFPFGNVIGGGRHAVGGTTIQEYLVVSQGPTVQGNVFANARVHHLVRDALTKKMPDVPLGRVDQGAWIAQIEDEEALALLTDVCRGVEREVGFAVRPALDLAAAEVYRGGKYRYRDRALSREEQIDLVDRLVRE